MRYCCSVWGGLLYSNRQPELGGSSFITYAAHVILQCFRDFELRDLSCPFNFQNTMAPQILRTDGVSSHSGPHPGWECLMQQKDPRLRVRAPAFLPFSASKELASLEEQFSSPSMGLSS